MSSRSSVDERSTAAVEANRRGAHRARPGALPALLPAVAGVAVIALVGFGAFQVIGRQPASSSSVAAAVEDDATPSAGATSAASTTRSSTPAGEPAATTKAAATVDQSIPLVVLNSVGVKGLAAKVKSSLEADGWQVTRTDNSVQRNLATTTVYYGSSAQRATARKVVGDLQFGQVSLNSSVTKGTQIVVVLGQDSV